MTSFGYHASHEQFSPRDLLELVCRAETAGFTSAMCSDHIMPWSDSQGESGYAWSWLGAAMQATTLPFGVVTAPGWRYHPAVTAQAAATLASMFPERFWMAVGSGEALNEHITGEAWPSKRERNARLKESADIIQALLRGEWVTHRGLVTVEEARLYSLPSIQPLIVGAAITPETASWLGSWADGMITVGQPHERLRAVVEAFRNNGGSGKRLIVQVKLSYDADVQRALQGAHEQWRTNVFPSQVAGVLRTPAQFEAAAQFVTPEQVSQTVWVSSQADQFVDWLGRTTELGFDEVYLHNVNRDQARFIDFFGEHVLPQL